MFTWPTPTTALSRQISIGDFRRRIRPSAAVIREQKQWSSSAPWCANRQYRIYSDNARVVVEEPRDIGLGQGAWGLASPEQREPRPSALRVRWIGLERLAERARRAFGVAELFSSLAERE